MLDYKAFLPLADQLGFVLLKQVGDILHLIFQTIFVSLTKNGHTNIVRKADWLEDCYRIARLVSYKPKKRNNSKQLNKVFKTIVSMHTL